MARLAGPACDHASGALDAKVMVFDAAVSKTGSASLLSAVIPAVHLYHALDREDQSSYVVLSVAPQNKDPVWIDAIAGLSCVISKIHTPNWICIPTHLAAAIESLAAFCGVTRDGL